MARYILGKRPRRVDIGVDIGKNIHPLAELWLETDYEPGMDCVACFDGQTMAIAGCHFVPERQGPDARKTAHRPIAVPTLKQFVIEPPDEISCNS